MLETSVMQLVPACWLQPWLNPRGDGIKTLACAINSWKKNDAKRGERGKKTLSVLRSLGKDYATLITDPGIHLRIDDFASFVSKSPKLVGTTPWFARQAYASHLGNVTVYRALALTPAEFLRVLREGMKSSLMRNRRPLFSSGHQPTSLSEEIRYQLQGPKQSGPWGPRMPRKPDPYKALNPVLSVTGHPEIAIFVALKALYRGFYPHEEQPEIYLFKIDVPELDIVYQGDAASALPYARGRSGLFRRLPDWLEKLKNGEPMEFQYPNGSNFSFSINRDLESFLLFRIARSEITAFRKVPKQEWESPEE